MARPRRVVDFVRDMRSIALSLLLATLASCGLSTQPTVIATPPGFDGFPVESSDAEVWAEAVLYTDHVELLGEDLVEQGVLPLALRVGLVSGDVGRLVRLSPESFDPRLYLPDGTVLGAVRERRMRSSSAIQRAARDHGLELTLLPAWTAAEEGFLFLELGDVRVERNFALTHRQGHYRELDLFHALLAFVVETDAGPREVRVGLRPGYGRSRR